MPQLAEQTKKGLMEVVVVDCDRGICASLRERFPDLGADGDALEKAYRAAIHARVDFGLMVNLGRHADGGHGP